MKVISFRRALYSISSCSLSVPVARKVNTMQGQWSDEEGVNSNVTQETTTFCITIPWLSVSKLELAEGPGILFTPGE